MSHSSTSTMLSDLIKSFVEALKKPQQYQNNPYILVSVAFMLSLVFTYIQGIRFDDSTIGYFVQLLDMKYLKTDLLRSLFYLHSQPPLYNLVTGLALKTGPYFSHFLLRALYYALGYLAVLSICDILLSLKTSKIVAVSVASIIAFLPQFIIYQNWYFYTHPVVALLLLTACLFLRSGGEANGYLMGGVLSFTTIILLRSLYHPALMLIAFVLCLIIMKDRKRVAKIFALPTVLVFLWCLKNLLIFGFFGTSSWSGQNIHKATRQYVGDDLYLKEYLDGNLSEMTGIWEFSEGSIVIETMSLSPEEWGVPILDDDYKSNESMNRTNLNHWSHVRVSPVLTDDSLFLIKEYPTEYFKGVWRLGVPVFFLTKSLDPYFHKKEINALPTLEKITSTIETSKITLLIVFIGIVLNIIFLFKDQTPEHRLFYLFSYSVIAYIIIVGLFGELGENYRFKYNAMWLVVCLSLAGLNAGIQWGRKKVSRREA